MAEIDGLELVFEAGGDNVDKIGPILTVAFGLALRREGK